jgi:predicted phosphodiesterase
MKTIAIVSDIHSNLEALTAVLAEIDALGVQTLYSLGDTIGYGPDPEACTRLARTRFSVRLLGNHEFSILNPGIIRNNPVAERAMTWTRRRLEAVGLLDEATRLPKSHFLNDALFVHGSVRGVIADYVTETDYRGGSAFDAIVDSLERDFTTFRICFVGHNHKPFLATADGFIHPHDDISEFYVASGKLYISVGSVGQPRDDDPRACFVTFDGESVRYHRVAYDLQATQAKIIAAGLDPSLAARLTHGH